MSLNVWPDVVPLRVLLKCMPQSAQQRLRKVLSHELDAEGQPVAVLATRQGNGGGTAEIEWHRESAPKRIRAQASKLFLEAELLSPL